MVDCTELPASHDYVYNEHQGFTESSLHFLLLSHLTSLGWIAVVVTIRVDERCCSCICEE